MTDLAAKLLEKCALEECEPLDRSLPDDFMHKAVTLRAGSREENARLMRYISLAAAVVRACEPTFANGSGPIAEALADLRRELEIEK